MNENVKIYDKMNKINRINRVVDDMNSLQENGYKRTRSQPRLLKRGESVDVNMVNMNNMNNNMNNMNINKQIDHN